MDIFFQDPGEIPLPPEDVRIQEFRAIPWADGRRVRVNLVVDPFQKRPNAEVQILNSQQEILAEVSIIETMTRKMELNMHLRQNVPAGAYQARVSLYYVPTAPEGEPAALEQPSGTERQVVDTAQVEFILKDSTYREGTVENS